MAGIIDPEDKKRVKELFSQWMDVQESRKQLNEESGTILKDAKDILESKSTSQVTALFKFMKKKYEDGVDELDQLNEMAVLMED